MDYEVSGRAPSKDAGKLFVADRKDWGGLWHFSVSVFPEMVDYVARNYEDEELLDELIAEGFDPQSLDNGYTNIGWGLNAEGAEILGGILQEAIEEGIAQEAADQLMYLKTEEPLYECPLCDGSGIRTDDRGIELGMHTKKLDEMMAIIVGRTRGYCNACKGYGKQETYLVNYNFTVGSAVKFAEFCLNSGGFAIY
jgi:hypothetical protein